MQVKAEVMVKAMAKARVDIDLNQKADHQETVPIVVQVTLPRGAKHLVKNATIATRKVIFTILQVKAMWTFPIPNKI